jgi:hypothetical protein
VRRDLPDVESVELDDDGEHVRLRWVGGDECRHRLCSQAKRFLLGEFFAPVEGGLDMFLRAPCEGGQHSMGC